MVETRSSLKSQGLSPSIPQVQSTGNKSKRAREDDEKNDARKKPATTRMKACSVCLNEVEKSQFPAIPHAFENEEYNEDSEHTSDVCVGCWDEHLDAEIKNKAADAISCAQCTKKLGEPDVERLAKRDTYNAYLDKAAKSCMQQDEEFHACPSADCSWGAFFAKGDGNIFVCQLCSVRHCLSCNVPFHESLTCEEYLAAERKEVADERTDAGRRKTEETASLAFLKTMSKPCPQCGTNLDKYDGCDHVVCERPSCDHEFCWECLAPYEGATGIAAVGNSAHKETCKHHSRRLPDLEDPNAEDYASEEDV